MKNGFSFSSSDSFASGADPSQSSLDNNTERIIDAQSSNTSPDSVSLDTTGTQLSFHHNNIVISQPISEISAVSSQQQFSQQPTDLFSSQIQPFSQDQTTISIDHQQSNGFSVPVPSTVLSCIASVSTGMQLKACKGGNSRKFFF
jgi:hypothetical protein